MRNLDVGGRIIGDGQPVWIVAEIGGNFMTFEEGRRLVDLAVECGVDAVKIQTFEAGTIATRKAEYDMPNVGRANQFALFEKYQPSQTLQRDIWNYCRDSDVFVFSTPSHMKDVEFLETLDTPLYKIGSDDGCNIPFIEAIAALGKPVILSTGMSTMEEVRESVSAVLARNADLALLHCVTNYPSRPEFANLRCIREMEAEFGVPVGWSDHTLTTVVPILAAAIGARIIEKHFTADKNAEGPDHMLSADPAEMRAIVDGIRTWERAAGDGVKRPSADERTTRHNNRKSLVTTRDITEGTVITAAMVEIKRPGYGIAPKFRDQVIGRVARRAIGAEEAITWDDV